MLSVDTQISATESTTTVLMQTSTKETKQAKVLPPTANADNNMHMNMFSHSKQPTQAGKEGRDETKAQMEANNANLPSFSLSGLCCTVLHGDCKHHH